MEEEPEDLSSLHYQILFPPREPSHQQREYELEQHLALMDEPARAPAQKAMDMGDLGNLTIEHLTSYDKDETQERFLFMEDEEKCQDDVLDIGIEANDLGSLLQQFEQTEAAAMTDSMEHREIPKSRLKSSKHQDAKNLAKKITPVKRKSTILLEPLAMPTKRLRAKETNLLIAERECVSLPGSRTSSPVTIQHQGLSEICSADQGFDYLVMDHDYCSPSGQKVNQINSASSSPLNDSNRLSVEERKAVYKQKYKIRKKGKKLSGPSGGKHSESAKEGVLDPVNLINKLPDYIRPMPEVAVPVKTNQTGKQTEDKSTERAADDPTEEENIQDKDSKPSFFDKIPDYFLGKHMYQEISKVEEEEARKKEEEEMTKLKEKEELEKFQQIKDTSKDHSHRYRSRHRQRDRGRHHRKTQSSICEEEQDLNRDKSVTTETLESDTGNTGVITDDKHCNEYAQSPATEFEGISHGHSHCENRKTSGSDRYSRCRSLSSLSSRSRSSSRSLSRDRSCSTSSSCSSYPRRRCRRDSRMSYTSLSSTSQSRSRSRSRSRSLRRRRRRRYSTYSSASRSSSSRSRSRSHSRPRHWRPRSHSRSHSRSSSSSRRRSRSGSYYSRSRSRESDRRRRDSHRRRHSRSRSRRRMRSVSVERIQKERREERLKEQQEQWSDRRVVYIGRIPNGTTRNTLRKRFEKFGEIERITLHFRDVGDNYAFVTFMYKCDAYAAVDGANKDYNEPEYDICFGGRRHFCRTNYEDLDSMGQEEIALDIGYQQEPASNQGGNKMETDFDRLLREAMKKSKR